MATASTGAGAKTCPVCGHENVPHAQFCAKCGDALDADPVTFDAADSTQATSTYEPIGAATSEPAWAEPEAERTSTLPVQDAVWSPAHPDEAVPRDTTDRESPRGFVLGTVATFIILAVVAYYIYAAWLSGSVQDDLTGWLPW